MLRRRLGNGITLCGLVLIILSFQAERFWNENSPEYLNLKEAGLVYGLVVMILGIVLIVKKISVLHYLWLTWIGLFITQTLRMYGKGLFVSRFMNSIEVFWVVLILGAILSVISIWYKCISIF